MPVSSEVNQGTIDAVLEISARRAKTLHEIKSMLEDDRDSEALRAMRSFLQVEKKSKTPQLKLVENECAPKRRRRG